MFCEMLKALYSGGVHGDCNINNKKFTLMDND